MDFSKLHLPVRLALLGLLVCAALLAAGCDYPEEGYYELVLHTAAADGQNNAGLASDKGTLHVPFMVEELTDDTDLTIGFNILLARNGELVLIPLDNSDDHSIRGWSLAAGAGDTGYGDLELLLQHYEEQLSFVGKFRNTPTGQVLAYASTLSPEDGRAPIEPPLDLIDNGKAYNIAWLEVREISQKDFERVLGGPVAKAKRATAVRPAPLPEAVNAGPAAEDAQASAESGPDKPRLKPTHKGRGNGRS